MIENGSYKFNVFLVVYAMRAGGLMLCPRGGVSARRKPPNNLPQLVLIGSLPGNFSRDCPLCGHRHWKSCYRPQLQQRLLLDTLASSARLWISEFLIKAALPIFGAKYSQRPALALAPSPLPFPTFPRSSQGCFLTPHSLAIAQTCVSYWTKSGDKAWPVKLGSALFS